MVTKSAASLRQRTGKYFLVPLIPFPFYYGFHLLFNNSWSFLIDVFVSLAFAITREIERDHIVRITEETESDVNTLEVPNWASHVLDLIKRNPVEMFDDTESGGKCIHNTDITIRSQPSGVFFNPCPQEVSPNLNSP